MNANGCWSRCGSLMNWPFVQEEAGLEMDGWMDDVEGLS